MPFLVLIRCGGTDWEEEGRIRGCLDVPLGAKGIEAACLGAEELREIDFSVIYSGQDTGSLQTAAIIGEVLSKPVKVLEGLREVDLGLWQGMLTRQLRLRQPRAYNQWVHNPVSMCPPDGESILQAGERLERALKMILKRHKNGAFAMVCPPIASALVRCLVKEVDLNKVWEVLSDSPVWEVCEVAESP